VKLEHISPEEHQLRLDDAEFRVLQAVFGFMNALYGSRYLDGRLREPIAKLNKQLEEIS
jgi:hypothetical protein